MGDRSSLSQSAKQKAQGQSDRESTHEDEKLWFESFLFDLNDIRATKKVGTDRAFFFLWCRAALPTDLPQTEKIP
jgi:hypothetical protein